MPPVLSVNLCVNDRRGECAGNCVSIKLRGLETYDVEAELERMEWDEERQDYVGAHFMWGNTPPVGPFMLAGHVFEAYGHRSRVGNVHWDGVTMPLEEARRLVKHALSVGFACIQHTMEGPVADLVREVA